MKKFVKIVSYITFCLVFVALICVAVLTYNSNIRIGGRSFVAVITDSMEPTIQAGSLIIVDKPPPVNQLSTGDIITFNARTANGGSRIVTHRIEYILERNNQTVFRTRGDNAFSSDANLVRHSDILGIYSAENGVSIIMLGRILAFLAHPIGLATLGLVIIIIFATIFIIKKFDGGGDVIFGYLHNRAKKALANASHSLDVAVAEFAKYKEDTTDAEQKQKAVEVVAQTKCMISKLKDRIEEYADYKDTKQYKDTK